MEFGRKFCLKFEMSKKNRILLCQIYKKTGMKGFVLRILPAFFMLLPLAVAAQQPETTSRVATVMPTPRSEWLGSFSGISINGRMHVRLIKNTTDEGPRITYDHKGEISAKFKVAVDRSGVLKIEEPIDPKRTTITEVTVWCNDISSLSVTAADLTFENTIARDMFDLEVAGGANVVAKLEVTDLVIGATGRYSTLVVEGTAKYLSLDISTAKFDGTALSTVSAIVDASHLAEVQVSASERLQGTTSTSAKILYTGEPSIVRARTTMFGGEITSVKR